MWLFFFLVCLPIYAAVDDDEMLICSVGSDPYDAKFEACPIYRTAGLLPFCVYMRTPATETTQGYDTYGCVYSKNLPTECAERGEYYTDWATVTFRGNRNISGAMMCCNQKYCNRVDDVMVSMIRLMATKKLNTIWVPIIFGTFLCIIALMPLFHWYTEKRHLQDSQRAEHPEPIREDLVLDDQKEVEIGEPRWMVSMAFDNYEEIEYLMKQMAGEQRTVTATLTSATNLPGEGKAKGRGIAVEEKETTTNLSVIRVPMATVVMKDQEFPHAVKRLHPTKFDQLAMKMIEHGPYRYNFDPMELSELFESCMEIFKREPTLIRLRAQQKKKHESDLIVYGNLEGNYGDLFRWFHKNGWPFKKTVVFLGGLTSSREEYSLETLALILALKKMVPHHVYILRGPSEVYPFCFKKRLPLQLANSLTEALSRAFDYLPLAATINDAILLCHGGVTKNIRHLRQIENINRPLKNIKMGSIAADLIFSTVGPEQRLIEGARGTCLSYDQDLHIETGQHKGPEIQFLIRARNSCPQGFLIHSGRMMTLWSSTNEIPPLDAEIGEEWDCGIAASVLISMKKPDKEKDMTSLELDFCVLMPYVTRYDGIPYFLTEAATKVLKMKFKEEMREKKKIRQKQMSEERKMKTKKMIKAKGLISKMGLEQMDQPDGKAASTADALLSVSAKSSLADKPSQKDKITL